MARRASSTTNPVIFIVIAVVAVAAIAGAISLKKSVSDPFGSLPQFPVADYMQNSNSLRGNTYKLEAVVGEQLRWVESKKASVVSVEIGGEPVPIVVPAELRTINIQRGQRYIFKVEVGDKGILKATQARKS